MSAALIRKCNKCSAPFIKENGCNKVRSRLDKFIRTHEILNCEQMTCTKCRNIQCYICSKSCEYSHFNDVKRGGKEGNCPLFDEGGIEIRHSEEVKNAEAEARKKVLAENSGIRADILDIKTSEKVKADEERRKKPGEPHRCRADQVQVGLYFTPYLQHARRAPTICALSWSESAGCTPRCSEARRSDSCTRGGAITIFASYAADSSGRSPRGYRGKSPAPRTACPKFSASGCRCAGSTTTICRRTPIPPRNRSRASATSSSSLSEQFSSWSLRWSATWAQSGRSTSCTWLPAEYAT